MTEHSREEAETVKLALEAMHMSKTNLSVRVALENLKEIVDMEKVRRDEKLN